MNIQRGRRIAFDYGDARIGVAISDPDAILASPLVTLKRLDKKLISTISEIFKEYEPITIYVGKPSNMDGTTGLARQKSTAFVTILKTLTTVPIIEIDERLSTVSASRSLREAGVNAKASKNRIDEASAVAILEFALSIEKNRQ